MPENPYNMAASAVGAIFQQRPQKLSIGPDNVGRCQAFLAWANPWMKVGRVIQGGIAPGIVSPSQQSNLPLQNEYNETKNIHIHQPSIFFFSPPCAELGRFCADAANGLE